MARTITILAWSLLHAYAGIQTMASTPCYFQDGTVATGGGGAVYEQCPGYDFCCLPGDHCDGATGLCRDIHNYGNGTSYCDDTGCSNYTGLYQTPACVNADFSGCDKQCISDGEVMSYIWGCNDAMSEFCCADGASYYHHQSCCSNGHLFGLSSAVNADSNDTSASSTSSTSPTSAMSTSEPTSAQLVSSGLSSGAKAGIVIGAVIAAVVLLGTIAWLRRRRITQRQRHMRIAQADGTEVRFVGKVERADAKELGSYAVQNDYSQHLDGKPVFEIDSQQRYHEMGGTGYTHELPAGNANITDEKR